MEKNISPEEYYILLKAFIEACNLLSKKQRIYEKSLTPEEIMFNLMNKARKEEGLK